MFISWFPIKPNTQRTNTFFLEKLQLRISLPNEGNLRSVAYVAVRQFIDHSSLLFSLMTIHRECNSKVKHVFGTVENIVVKTCSHLYIYDFLYKNVNGHSK